MKHPTNDKELDKTLDRLVDEIDLQRYAIESGSKKPAKAWQCQQDAKEKAKTKLQPLLKQAELRGRKSELNKLPHSGTHDNGMFEYYEISKRYIDERLEELESQMEKER